MWGWVVNRSIDPNYMTMMSVALRAGDNLSRPLIDSRTSGTVVALLVLLAVSLYISHHNSSSNAHVSDSNFFPSPFVHKAGAPGKKVEDSHQPGSKRNFLKVCEMYACMCVLIVACVMHQRYTAAAII